MPNRSIRDEMRQTPQTPRVYGTPIGATGVRRPINTGRPVARPASPEVRHRAIQAQIGGPGPAARPRPAVPPSAGPAAPPPPQAMPSGAPPTTLVPGNPTRDITVGTAADRLEQHPGLLNQAVDQMAR